VKGFADACTDLRAPSRPVVSDDKGGARSHPLNAGDIVSLEGAVGRPARIVVRRRVWDELSSPELVTRRLHEPFTS